MVYRDPELSELIEQNVSVGKETNIEGSRGSFKLNVSDLINPELENLLKILVAYEIKTVSRNCSNNYICEKTGLEINRKETLAEHVVSCLKLADFFIMTEEEFSDIDRLKVYDILLYHDDAEIETDDTCISNREGRKTKETDEKYAIPLLASKYPHGMGEKLIDMDSEYRQKSTKNALFASAIDKFDALIHEIKYPQDRGPAKKFDEKNVRAWFQSSFEHSQTFMKYFEDLITFLNQNGYFKD